MSETLPFLQVEILLFQKKLKDISKVTGKAFICYPVSQKSDG